MLAVALTLGTDGVANSEAGAGRGWIAEARARFNDHHKRLNIACYVQGDIDGDVSEAALVLSWRVFQGHIGHVGGIDAVVGVI